MRFHSSLISVAIMLLCGSAMAQGEYQLSFIAELSFENSPSGCPGGQGPTGGSDVWGYTAPDGAEYAIMGVKEGVAVVAVPEMELIDIVPGPQSGDCWWHRDIKTYDHYAYVVAEMTGTNQGIMILDLQYLPDSVRFVGSYVSGTELTSHNMTIDTATGYAYACDRFADGFRVISLADPENPVDVNNVFTAHCHDVFARNDTVYSSDGYLGRFSIFDASDKSDVQLIGRVTVPSAGYCHNAWPTDDGRYVMTTEETDLKTVKMWDITGIADDEAQLVSEYLAPNNLAHNVHVMGDFAFISHYSYGISVLDISDPQTINEVAHYDTYSGDDDPGFWGAWGVYPYSPSGYVFASDFRGILTVLKFEAVITEIDGNGGVPSAFHLGNNYPDPFNPQTVIPYDLPVSGNARLAVFNSLGQQVRVLIEDPQSAGSYVAVWDGRDGQGNPVPSGVYFYRLMLYSPGHIYRTTETMTLAR